MNIKKAKELRKNMTNAEIKLWYHLRNRNLNGFKFRRQQPIGKYIVDFVNQEKKLIIEVDGSQHLKHEDYDKERTKLLKKYGYKVIRFWNNDVLTDIGSIKESILDNLE